MSCALPTTVSLFRSGLKGDDVEVLMNEVWQVAGDVTTQQIVDRAIKCGDFQAHSLELLGEIIIWNKERFLLPGAPDLSFFSFVTMVRGDQSAYPSEQEGHYVLIARF